MAPVPVTGVVVIAGGAGLRAGGADKALLLLDGRPLLAHVLQGVRAAVPAAQLVVVGPPRPGFAEVTWTREPVPGSGPLAALDAGLAALTEVDQVLLLGGDMPYVARGVPGLLAALDDAEAAVLVDEQGYDQPLASAWRWAALDSAVRRIESLEDMPLRRLLDAVPTLRLRGVEGATTDVDTLDDLRRLQGRD
jgi:molybdopterin-guanine dinucleotide biosynthesis protein A